MPREDARALLERGLNPHERKLNGRLTDVLIRDFTAWLRESPAAEGGPYADRRRSPLARQLLVFLQARVELRRQLILDLRKALAEFNRRYPLAAGPVEQHDLILDFARELGATWSQLGEDRRALRRWLDRDAIVERCSRRQASAERELVFCLRLLGEHAAAALDAVGPGKPQEELWQRLRLEKTAQPLLRYEDNDRVALAAFRSLSAALCRVNHDDPRRFVDDETLRFIYRSALDSRQQVWLQCEAIGLLQYLSPSALQDVLEQRLRRPAAGDDLFVRRRAVEVLGRNLTRLPGLAELLPSVAADPSPFVRQGFAALLANAPAEIVRQWLEPMTCHDQVPQVRAAAIWESLALLRRGELGQELMRLLVLVLDQEPQPFVQRVAMHAVAEGAMRLADNGDEAMLERWRTTLEPHLIRLHIDAGSLSVRRWAAQARERLWCAADGEARALHRDLMDRLRSVPRGQSLTLSRDRFGGADEAVIGRVLSVIAQDDCCLDLRWSWWDATITRDHRFGFRLWRLIHELRHPDPAKRQAFRHTIGRVSNATVRAPSALMAELAETKVPGEPLVMSSEGGWRPYLPLVDDVISSLNQGLWVRPVRFFTSEGVTELTPPRTPWGRWWAFVRLTLSFPHFARLRNWQEGDQSTPAGYLQALTRLGFRVRILPHEGMTPDPAVTRFFPPEVSSRRRHRSEAKHAEVVAG